MPKHTGRKKKDPLFVDGKRPRPMYIDYKDVDLLQKFVSRQGRMIGRRKTGCTAVSQHSVSQAINRLIAGDGALDRKSSGTTSAFTS